ncbi:MAG: GNAT family N-acetyltransferase [Bdellovibrionales bacterium]|nr:GNAT family N-acetyltransferase [Massilia sp.]
MIRPAGRDDLPSFFAYLNDHLSDNGKNGTALFMPMARNASFFPPDKESAFRCGMDTPVGEPLWRRLWLAVGDDGEIAGHIDLRARPEKPSAHRALLGMGVHRGARQRGLGARLVELVAHWAAAEGFDWIDLEVLSVNQPARALYARCGFVQVGEIDDMFRIDGETLGYTFMTRKLG